MACKITKTTEHRKITAEEFKKQKGYGDYKKYRQIAKSLNFLLIFGGSESVLSQSALEVFWTPKQVKEYLKDNHCEKELEEVANKYKTFDEEKQQYVAAASKMRKGFFEGYPGLLERCAREVEYAHNHGYCCSVFGAVRNQIELLLKGAYDDKFESGNLRNIENISKNYLAQNYEACIRGRAMREMSEWLLKMGYKSKVFNEVHDSIDLYIYKKETQEVLSHLKHLEERKIPELLFNWVPLPVDCSLSDLTKGQYYKQENSAESHGYLWDGDEYGGAEMEDIDPFGVELAPELETEYFDKRKLYWEHKGQLDPQGRAIQKYRKERGV